MKCYKLTDQNMQTRGGCQWNLNEEKTPLGNIHPDLPLCSDGWLHFYTDPLLAVLLNPIHANIQNPRLFEAECDGYFKDDNGLKVGYTKAKLVKEIPLPEITLEQRIKFAILCTKEVYKAPDWSSWADRWLSGEDRSNAAAYAAANAAVGKKLDLIPLSKKV